MRWNHNGGVLLMACSLFRDIGVRDERESTGVSEGCFRG